MQALKQLVKIPKNHKILINIPTYIKSEQLAEIIIIIKENNTIENKINEIKKSINDPLFMDDLKQINQDFSAIDNEGW